MISTASFFDELEKIGEATQKQEPGEGPGGPFVTKDRLKRLGQVALLGGIGAGLGTATGYALRRYLLKNHPGAVAKYSPYVLPAAGMSLGILGGMHRSHADYLIRHGSK